MQSNNRIIATALVVLGVLVAALSFHAFVSFKSYQREHIEAREQKAGDDAKNGNEQVTAQCVPISGSVALECVMSAPHTKTEATTSQTELKALQDAAEWAYASQWASVFGIFVSLAGVIYVALTLGENRKATAAALASAAATVRVASAERARIVFSGGTLAVINGGVAIAINWVNGGRTAATNAMAMLQTFAQVPGQPLPEFEGPEGFTPDGRMVIGVGTEIQSGWPQFSDAKLRQICSREVRLILNGVVEYYDIWNDGPFYSYITVHADPLQTFEQIKASQPGHAFLWRPEGPQKKST